jgi:hypothetical protein
MAQGPSRGVQSFLLLFVAIGVAVVGAGVWTLVKSIRTESWPVTDGVIESANVKAHSGSKGGTSYSPEVTYTYRVGGAKYDGDKIAVGQMSSSSEYAHGVLSRYPVGSKVTVHYSPTDPAEAVLETGIHGGTWICFGVGTAFVLFGAMFLQIMRAANRAQLPGAAASSTVRTNPDGSISLDKPPVLMGVIFLLAGVGICFAQPSGGTPHWVIYAAGGMFALAGVFIVLYQLENKLYSKIPMLIAVALLLAIFHWVSFGGGERIGTSSTPFSTQSGVNVRWPFAIFTSFFDLILLAAAIHWLVKRRRD